MVELTRIWEIYMGASDSGQREGVPIGGVEGVGLGDAGGGAGDAGRRLEERFYTFVQCSRFDEGERISLLLHDINNVLSGDSFRRL